MNTVLLLLAGLAFFLYGIERLSALLSKMVGGHLQEKLISYSSNDSSKVFIGVVITTLFQSSSATTVILVSMASAGFITVAESISFILGANIGSVSTAWIVAVKITELALPLFIIGVVGNFFANSKRLEHFFTFILGLGLIFYGLNLMSDSLEYFKQNQEIVSFMAQFNAESSLASMLILMVSGIIFTAVIQSSGATAAMVITASMTGLFNLHSAAAIVLGATLGTTITAFLASLGGSDDGKRVAMMQVGINIIGILFGAFLFYPSVSLVMSVGNFVGDISISFLIAMYMTMLKCFLVIIIFPIRNIIANISYKILKQRYSDLHLLLEFPEKPRKADKLFMKEILEKNTEKMFLYLRDMMAYSYIVIRKPKETALYDKLIKYEIFIDSAHRKMVRTISKAQNDEDDYLWLYLKMSDEIESIADHAKAIAKYGMKIHNKNIILEKYKIEALRKAYRMIFDMFHVICIEKEYDAADLNVSKIIERFLRSTKRELLTSLTGRSTDLPDDLLYVVDILAEYSKVNHCLKRILQVNLDVIDGRAPFLYKKRRP